MFVANITTSKMGSRTCLIITEATIAEVESQNTAVEIIALKFQLHKMRQLTFCLGKEWRLMYLKRELEDRLDQLSMCLQLQVTFSIKTVNCRLNSTEELAMDADSENLKGNKGVERGLGCVNM